MPVSGSGTPAYYTEPVDCDPDAMRRAFDAPAAQAIWYADADYAWLKRAGMVAAIVAGLLWCGAAASAQEGPQRQPCNQRDKITAMLGAKYQEAPVAVGLQADGNALEIFATADGKTFTVVVTKPDGMSCLVAAGRDFQMLRPTSMDPMA